MPEVKLQPIHREIMNADLWPSNDINYNNLYSVSYCLQSSPVKRYKKKLHKKISVTDIVYVVYILQTQMP